MPLASFAALFGVPVEFGRMIGSPSQPWTAPAGPGPDVGAVYPVHHRSRRERKRARQRAQRAGLR